MESIYGLVLWADWTGVAGGLQLLSLPGSTQHIFSLLSQAHPYSRCFHRWWEMRPCMKKPSTTTDWRKPWDLSLVHTKHTHTHSHSHEHDLTVPQLFSSLQVCCIARILLPPTMLHRLPLTQNKRFSTSLTGAKLRTSSYWTDLLMHRTQNYRPGSFQHPHIYVLCPFENSQSLQNLRISIHKYTLYLETPQLHNIMSNLVSHKHSSPSNTEWPDMFVKSTFTLSPHSCHYLFL